MKLGTRLLSTGLVLVFVNQVLAYVSTLTGIVFINEGEISTSSSPGFVMYIIPLIFIISGILVILSTLNRK